MKRIIIICLLCTAILCACQPTPEVDAVKQKDTNVLIDAVKAEQQEQQNAGVTLPPVKEQFPKRFACDFYTTAQNVHVVADAPLEVLTSGTFPMLRVEHRYLSDTERLTIVKRLLKSDDLYIYEYRPTREALERMIRELMQEPTPEDKAAYMADFGTEEEWQEMMEHRKETLAQYQKQYNEMTDDTLPALLHWSGTAPVYSRDFEHNSNLMMIVNSESVSGFFDYAIVWANECDRPVEFQIAQRDIRESTSIWSFDFASKPGTERIDPSDYDKSHEGANITPNDAIRIAQSYLDGFEPFAASDVYWSNNAQTDGDTKGINAQTRWAYLIHLSPIRYGATGVYCAGNASDVSEDEYVRQWDYETLMAAVDGNGNLISLVWLAPLKVTDVIAESTTLLSYEEIQKIFEQQINRMFAYDEANGATLTLDYVQLGLFRIREKNDLEHGLLVPAWFFTGHQQNAEAHKGEYGDGFVYDNLNPLLIINAIDGSIIDPMKGY